MRNRSSSRLILYETRLSVANQPPGRAYWAVMCDGRRYETEWDGLRIVIEKRPKHFQVFIYDPGKCEVLYTAERMSLDAAKFAAVDFERQQKAT